MTKRKESHTRDFALLFAGQTVSQLGTNMTSFALIIWIYTKNGQVMSSSLLAICSAIPYLIVSLFGGAVVDNANKKRIMLICDFVAVVCSFVILSCFISGILELWILCLVWGEIWRSGVQLHSSGALERRFILPFKRSYCGKRLRHWIHICCGGDHWYSFSCSFKSS